MEEVTLKDWLSEPHTKEEYQSLFLVMDMTMHYIHDKGYGVLNKRNQEGYPLLDTSRVKIITGKLHPQVLFSDIDIVDPSYQRELVHDNIYSNAYLAIKTYAGFQEELNHTFLKKNFREFELFLPEEDIPYYRGVIERDASVYYAEYVQKRTQREIEREGGVITGQAHGNSLSKSTEIGRQIAGEYSNLDNSSMAAFVHLYIFPAIIILLSMLIPIIAWVFALLEK